MPFLPASEVHPRPMPMIWRGRIPVGALTLIAGKPGLGKSTVATTIAAELSSMGLTGAVSNVEDDLAGVIRPRLEVARAVLERVYLIPEPDAPVFPRDMDKFEEMLVETEADYVVLDPIAAHFAPERRVHDRPTLRRIVAICRRHRCALIGVHHTVKSSTDGSALGWVGGTAGGLAGTSRAVYLYGYDPEDTDRRALACAKINGVEEPGTMICEHDVVEYETEGGVVEAGLLKMVGVSGAGAKSVLKPGRRNKRRDRECLEWLTLFLARGAEHQQQVQSIKAEGQAAGFGWQTVKRASLALKVEHVRVGFGGEGFWLWRLPEGHPLREDAEEEVRA